MLAQYNNIIASYTTRDEFQPQLMQTFDCDKVQIVTTMDGMFNGALETIIKIICNMSEDIPHVGYMEH